MFYTNFTVKQNNLWKFTDENGTFVANDPQKISALYFPLANEAEMMSSITPVLKGDIKTDNNSFLLVPTSRADLFYCHSSRNFWIHSKKGVWSTVHKSSEMTLHAGLLYHSLDKTNKKLGLQARITNFVPASNDHVELMIVDITNISNASIEVTATSAIPMYCRSADNLRDHRHVTSLLHRIHQERHGVIVQPTMSFDERGHTKNETVYYIFGIDSDTKAPVGSFPTYELFAGEDGSLHKPLVVYQNKTPNKYTPSQLNGKEAMGALRFKTKTLKPKETARYALILGIAKTRKDVAKTFAKYKSIRAIKTALEKNKSFWKNKSSELSFSTKNSTYDNWLRWVGVQPMLRKIFGCSFLPDFDYGRGGKGWRDLWQDCLSLLLIDPQKVRPLIKANFSGVRIDGTNATIITKKLGHFLSDRNKISRVWMDHGVWPYFTVELYTNQTGDYSILLEETTYFRDSQLSRAKEIDLAWNGCDKLKTKNGTTYKGSLLEHILIEHLVPFFNVGWHNSIRLENADWNDGLDMAPDKGESVAFSAFYGYNLKRIALILEKLKETKKIQRVALVKEILPLLDSLKKPINYNSVAQKTQLLNRYLQSVKYTVSGTSTKIKIDDIIRDLHRKADWLLTHIRTKEWITTKRDGFFNGYYDNKSRRVEGRRKNSVRMTLTGQVFPILNGSASDAHTKKIFKSVKKYLYDKKLKGFRLNTDFGGPQFNLGRAFAFSYGDKENGAIFSHMCVMFAYALYRRGFAKEGFEVLNSLYDLATNTAVSKIYPNLPEYFNLQGRGMYSYLTGSASWYIMTLLTQVFGIYGECGDLIIEPKVVGEQFKHSKELSVRCTFAQRKLSIRFVNPRAADYPHYAVKDVQTRLAFLKLGNAKILIKRRTLTAASSGTIPITIVLG